MAPEGWRERKRSDVYLLAPSLQGHLGPAETYGSVFFTQPFPFGFWKLLPFLLPLGLVVLAAPRVLTLGYLWFLCVLPTPFKKAPFKINPLQTNLI